jgi:hypothetical protein
MPSSASQRATSPPSSPHGQHSMTSLLPAAPRNYPSLLSITSSFISAGWRQEWPFSCSSPPSAFPTRRNRSSRRSCISMSGLMPITHSSSPSSTVSSRISFTPAAALEASVGISTLRITGKKNDWMRLMRWEPWCILRRQSGSICSKRNP